MNKISRYVLVVFVLASMLLGACAGAAPSVASDGGKVEASSVAYTGTIESINGTQWVVNGQTITVDPSVVKDGPFNIGDLVKVEVQVAQDGTVTVTRVELPSQVDMSQLPGLGDDNSNDANDNDANGNDVNGNDDNSNNANGNDSNSNDSNGNGGNSNSGNEVSGIVEAITTTSVTVNGLTYEFQSGVEIKGLIQAGDFVKIHLVQNADGTFSVREMELSDPSQVGNGNDSNSNDGNGNDDNGNDDNSNGNSNDDDDDDGNGNDDDNGGQGGGNDNGGNGNG